MPGAGLSLMWAAVPRAIDQSSTRATSVMIDGQKAMSA